MKEPANKPKKWVVFVATFVLLFVLTLVLILLSMGPQRGPFLYQIQ